MGHLCLRKPLGLFMMYNLWRFLYLLVMRMRHLRNSLWPVILSKFYDARYLCVRRARRTQTSILKVTWTMNYSRITIRSMYTVDVFSCVNECGLQASARIALQMYFHILRVLVVFYYRGFVKYLCRLIIIIWGKYFEGLISNNYDYHLFIHFKPIFNSLTR